MTADASAQTFTGNPATNGVSRQYRQRSPLLSSRSPRRAAIPSPTDRFFIPSSSSKRHSNGTKTNRELDGVTQTGPPTPPASLRSRSQGQEARRSRSPSRNPDMDAGEQEPIKREAPSDVEMQSPESTVRAPSEATAIPLGHGDPQIHPSQQQQQQQQQHPHPPPYSHGGALAPQTAGALLRQQILFERLHSICTYAARRYVTNLIRPRVVPPMGLLLDGNPRTAAATTGPTVPTSARRYHPYARPLPPPPDHHLGLMFRRQAPPPFLPLPLPLPGPNNNPNPPNLFNYIHPIADRLWSQARSAFPSGPRPAPIEAAHRMHNLYVWAGRVVGAVETVRAGRLVRDEEVVFEIDADLLPRVRRNQGQNRSQLDAILAAGPAGSAAAGINGENELFNDGDDGDGNGNHVLGAVLAARDLCGWCLCEDAQTAVEVAWAEWAVADDEDVDVDVDVNVVRGLGGVGLVELGR
ncbi:MAG: hypothetical protein M1816_005804 [Peltula sp. TS41687]|nr:MAG: hypothetical protein M1816_005804 [Peltula sp. TS41687]